MDDVIITFLQNRVTKIAAWPQITTLEESRAYIDYVLQSQNKLRQMVQEAGKELLSPFVGNKIMKEAIITIITPSNFVNGESTHTEVWRVEFEGEFAPDMGLQDYIIEDVVGCEQLVAK
jgi:hypothetical protein